MNDEILIYSGAGLSGTEYSRLLTTDMSRKLDDLFGFNYIDKFSSRYAPKLEKGNLNIDDIDEPEIFMNIQDILAVSQSPVRGIKGEVNIPLSREADYNFRSARTFMVAYRESEKIVDYFSELAKKVGFFFALPYNEFIKANKNITEDDVQIAIEEGYVRKGITTHVNGKPLVMIEITDKFCPLEKRLNN
jgi:hypothetical protein